MVPSSVCLIYNLFVVHLYRVYLRRKDRLNVLVSQILCMYYLSS